MTRSRLRTSLVICAAVAAVVAIVRTMRGGPVPAFELPDGPGAPWPTLRPDAEAVSAPDWVGPAAAPPDAGPLAEPVGEPLAEPLAEPVGAGSVWIAASGEPPPPSHPIKAKLGSGIYHLPGMMNYDRTRADRLYRTAAEAEADGLRAAKR